jgi:hypothetical protein
MVDLIQTLCRCTYYVTRLTEVLSIISRHSSIADLICCGQTRMRAIECFNRYQYGQDSCRFPGFGNERSAGPIVLAFNSLCWARPADCVGLGSSQRAVRQDKRSKRGSGNSAKVQGSYFAITNYTILTYSPYVKLCTQLPQ